MRGLPAIASIRVVAGASRVKRNCRTGGRRFGLSTVFVARSRALQNWASDVGLTLHIYKVGVAENGVEAVVDALNGATHAGRSDWELLAGEEADELDETTAIGRVARKETLVDPTYYPQIKRAPGIFKVKPVNVENHFILRDALDGQQIKRLKLTPDHVASYLIRMARG